MRTRVALLFLGAAVLVAMLIVVFGLPWVADEEALDISFFAFLFAGPWLYTVSPDGAALWIRGRGRAGR